MDNNEFLNNKILNSNDITLTSEVNKSNEQSSNNQIVNLDINAKFLDIVKTLNHTRMNDIKIMKIIGDGNYLYRCISFFYLEMNNFIPILEMKL